MSRDGPGIAVSVVVIGRDEGALLAPALTAAGVAAARLRERGMGDVEVLYVDSGSRDASLTVARALPGVRIVALPRVARGGAAQARNAGIAAARGRYVQLLDGDMTVDPDWLIRASAAFDRPTIAAVAGHLIETGMRRSRWNATFGLDWDRRLGRVPAVGGAALWRRDVLVGLDGFDPTLDVGEDPDLCWRATARGHEFVRIDAPMAGHDLDLRGPRGWWRRALACGRSRANVRHRHPAARRVDRRRRALHTLALLGIAAGVAVEPLVTLAVAAALGVVAIARRALLDRRAGVPLDLALLHALHTYAVKLPVALGAAGRTARLQMEAPRMTPDRLAWLAPELPSVSGTFVFREIEAVRRLGHDVVPFSLHATDPAALGADARAFLAETEVVYGDRGALLRGALTMLWRRPLPSLAVLALACRDAVRGRFAKPLKRLRVPLQALAGLHLAGRLLDRGVRHLHVHFAHAPATVGMYAARAAGIPWSVTAHANDLYVEAGLLREKLDRSSAFVTISAANRSWLAAHAGVPAERIDVIHCGVDTADWTPALRRPTRETTLVGVGRLVPKKGFDVLLEAAAPLLTAGRLARLVIAGDGPERARLAGRAAELGVAARVTLPGAVDRATIRELLATATAFVLPCRVSPDGDRDGIPVALMEAMAAGVPVVSTAVSGVPELIEDRVDGRCVAPDDADALRAALLEMLSDPRTTERMTLDARLKVERDFDRAASALRLLRRILPATARAASWPRPRVERREPAAPVATG